MTKLTNESQTSKSPVSNELSGAIVPVSSLSASDKDAMFALMASYYETNRAIFDADLSEKEHVILLTADSIIRGFSTICNLELGDIVALFSGDTVVHEDYRNEMLLPRLWASLAFGTADTIKAQNSEKRVYWFLISSGYKTYRYLPLFFREFYPHYDCPTPAPIQALMDTLAKARYPEEYQNGIVRLKNPTPVLEGVAEIQPRHLNNPHLAFFARINPNHHDGDELVCLTEIERHNLTPAGQRMVKS